MADQRPTWKVAAGVFFSLLATAAFIFVGVRAIAFFMPFVLGWILSCAIAPVINGIGERLKALRKLATAVMVILILGLFVFLFYFAVNKIVAEGRDFAKNFPRLYIHLEIGISQIEGNLSGLFARLPIGMREAFRAISADLESYGAKLVGRLSESTFAAAENFAKRLPSGVVSFIVSIVSAYFFTVRRGEILSFLSRKSPEAIRRPMILLLHSLKYAVGGFLKGQLKIMAVVFSVLLAGLLILKINYPVLVAFLIAFIDFIPIFGTGTVLIPWALYEIFVHSYQTAIALFVMYFLSLTLRQVLQPKLVGDSVGLNPLFTLALLYTGYKLKGVLGFLLAVPLGMAVIDMWQAGAFRYLSDDIKILARRIANLRKPSQGEENARK